jgi:DegV family protein with EDD domain
MRNYVIITDSTTDLSEEIIKELGINVIPLTFEMDGKTFKDRTDKNQLDLHEFYDKLRNGAKSVTSLVNSEEFIDFFEPILKEGNDILYIAFSSALSGTYNSSIIAKDELLEKYPESKIICIDSKAASAGEGLLVYSAVKKKEDGLSLDELEEWVQEYSPKVCHWFTVDDLNHLKRGGRVSALSATIGTALNVKPILHVDNEGRLIPMEKVRGRKKSIQTLMEHLDKTIMNPEQQDIFIGHGDTLEDAEFLAGLIREKYNVRNIFINTIGPVVGSHTGPGIIALFFFGKER